MKNKIKLILTVISVFLSTTGCIAFTNGLGSATIRVRIVDDESNPVEGVNSKILSASFYDPPSGFSDTNGMFSVYLKNIYLEIGGYFTKEGYYQSKGKFWKWGMSGNSIIPPANTNFTIVLKRIIEPVPMKKREVLVYAPRLGKTVGFDFEIGDLVAPDGKGEIADILFTTSKDYVADDDFTLYVNIEFIGEQTGILPFSYDFNEGAGYALKSDLPPPSPIAPGTGYGKTLECVSKCSPPSEWNRTRRPSHYAYMKNVWTGSSVENRKWIFRTRTVLDDDGKIIAANYGWTTTDIKLSAKPNSDYNELGIALTYYYNPDPNSRSLEPKEIADSQKRN